MFILILQLHINITIRLVGLVKLANIKHQVLLRNSNIAYIFCILQFYAFVLNFVILKFQNSSLGRLLEYAQQQCQKTITSNVQCFCVKMKFTFVIIFAFWSKTKLVYYYKSLYTNIFISGFNIGILLLLCYYFCQYQHSLIAHLHLHILIPILVQISALQ